MVLKKNDRAVDDRSGPGRIKLAQSHPTIMNTNTALLLLAPLLTLPAATAPAPLRPAPIIRRDDRPDRAYLDLALGYPQTCHVGLDGVGVLVAPRWILTAAHVARGVTFFEPTVRFLHEQPERGLTARIDRVVLHPDFAMSENAIEHDIALLRLAEPVEGVAPVPILRRPLEEGRLVTLVGDGDLGTGSAGALGNDGRWRAATNRPLEVREHELLFRFDAPDADDCTELEGFWGPGDSGTPAFVEVEGARRVAGIGSHGMSGTNGKPGAYGALDVSYRVSAYAAWIDATLEAHASTPASLEEPRGFDVEALSRLDGGEAALAHLDAIQADDRELRDFFAATFATEEAGRDAGVRLWLRHMFGDEPLRLTPVQFARRDGGIDVLARLEGTPDGLLLRYDFTGRQHELDRVEGIPVPWREH